MGMDLQTPNVKVFHGFEHDDHEDDDVYYSELRKQVLQLTEDYDDDVDDNDQVWSTDTVQARTVIPGLIRAGGYYNNWEIRPAPTWASNLWRTQTGNGTGVFIPRSTTTTAAVQSRRRHRSRRKKNERGRAYKHVEKTN